MPAVHFESHGDGQPLILGFPVTATASEDDPEGAALRGYIDRLCDRYKVVVMDYPNQGRSERMPANQLTVDRACADVLRVADQAGFERFAWWGFSWGGVIGLQLASRSDRISALVCGGWPPLGAPYAELLDAIRAMAANRKPGTLEELDQYLNFYQSMAGWPEAAAVTRIACPRMVFIGTADEVDLGVAKLPLSAIVRSRRAELERHGWRVAEIAGRDHDV